MAKRDRLVLPRLGRIAKHPNSWMSLVVGLAVFSGLAFCRFPSRHADIRIVELSGPLLMFTAMGFAVSLTAVALILAMPLGRMTALMVMNSRGSPAVQVAEINGKLEVRRGSAAQPDAADDRRQTAYLDLIAVFLVTAISNVISSAAVIIWSALIGGDNMLSNHSIENSILTAIVAALVIYSGAQMLTAVKTLYQVASLIQTIMRAELKVS
jgi:hypothetical protein